MEGRLEEREGAGSNEYKEVGKKEMRERKKAVANVRKKLRM